MKTLICLRKISLNYFKMTWKNGFKISKSKILKKTNFQCLYPENNKNCRIFSNREDQLQGQDKVEYLFLFFQEPWNNCKTMKKSRLSRKINFIIKCTNFLNWKKDKIQSNNIVLSIVSMFGNVKTTWNQKISWVKINRI